MSYKEKILFIFGTRPEIIRMSSIINKAKNFCDLKILNTSQNFDNNLNKIFLNNFKIKVDYSFKNTSSNFIDFFGNSILNINLILEDFTPDKVVVLGDTNSALLSYFFKRLNIPIFHIEAGNRSFDERIPEETNRKIIDHFSDYNFVYSERARQNLILENISPNRIFLIGSPLNEVFNDNISSIKNSQVLRKLHLKKNSYFLISFHRYENINDDIVIKKFKDLIGKLNKTFNKKIVISLHPSLKSKIDLSKNYKNNSDILFLNPFSYFDYCKLQINSFFTLSDSGSISEECSILKFRALSIRYSIERQEATESGFTPIVGLDIDKILNLINFHDSKFSKLDNSSPKEYKINNTSKRFLNILLGSNYK